MSLLLKGQILSYQALEPVLDASSSDSVPYIDSLEVCASLASSKETDVSRSHFDGDATTWSRTLTMSSSSYESVHSERPPHLPTFCPTFAALAWAHFHSEATQDDLENEMVEAISALPRDRFISIRSLTHLDALIGFAFKKYSSGQKVGDLLEKCLSKADRDKRLSGNTIMFLHESARTLNAEPSLRARLTAF